MKLNITILALALSSQSAFAFQCKTVMGGCPTDTGVVSSKKSVQIWASKLLIQKKLLLHLQKQMARAVQLLRLNYRLKSNSASGLLQTLNKISLK
jgi:hypothetical protein